jgi:hypothetical protein
MAIVRSTVWSAALIAATISASHGAPIYRGLVAADVDAMPARIDARLERIAAAATAKQQCMTACRARYRDCRRLNQLPSSECRAIYQDCTHYSCTGLGPG